MNFPHPSGMLNPWQFSSNTWKLISFVITWLHHNFFFFNPSLSFLNFAIFPLTTTVWLEQCLEMCITSTSCVCLSFYNVLLIAFLNCKSIWIKVSVKWINVNVNVLCCPSTSNCHISQVQWSPTFHGLHKKMCILDMMVLLEGRSLEESPDRIQLIYLSNLNCTAVFAILLAILPVTHYCNFQYK